MRNSWAAPALALCFGAGGALVRGMELSTGFDFFTGLAERGDVITKALIALCVAVAVCAVVFAIIVSKKYQAPDKFYRAFDMKNVALLAVLLIAGAVVIVGSVAAVTKPFEGVEGTALWVFAIFGMLSGISMIVMALSAFTRREGAGLLLCSVIPAIFYCYWMVVLYRNNAGNPVLLDYCFGCFAFASAALSFYYIAGFVFGKIKIAPTVLFTLLGIFFLMVNLADLGSLPLILVTIGTVVFLTISCGLLLENMEEK
jgi:hypothetical protein